jgi:sec-independent protein translocase protein TatA
MFTNFGLLDFGLPELLIILAIILLLFGGKKLPQLSKSIGESMTELRKGMKGDDTKSSTTKSTTPENKPPSSDKN